MTSSSALRSSKMHISISGYRSEFIDLRLKQFIQHNDISSWPLDCVKLLQKMKQSGKYGIQAIKVVKWLHEKVDAATFYDKRTGHYSICINYNGFSYPFKKSSDCRLNFTIAHEIGHIVLEHLMLNIKSDREGDLQSYMDDLEADEFAARLLMPIEMLSTFNYYSIPQVAAWLNVSNSALIARLNRLNRLDLITSRKIKSCTRCGNIRFSSFAVHCGVCGKYLLGSRKGIRRIYYPDLVKMDLNKRCTVCMKCQNDISQVMGEHCPYCYTSIFNLCSDKNCCYANPAYAQCCEICGKPTLIRTKSYHLIYCDKNHGQHQIYMVEYER